MSVLSVPGGRYSSSCSSCAATAPGESSAMAANSGRPIDTGFAWGGFFILAGTTASITKAVAVASSCSRLNSGTDLRAGTRADPPTSSAGYLILVDHFAVGNPRRDPLLAGHAVARPRHRVQPLRRDRLLTLRTLAVLPDIHAVQGVGNLTQQFHVDGVAVQKNPLFVVVLAQVAFVRRDIQPG